MLNEFHIYGIVFLVKCDAILIMNGFKHFSLLLTHIIEHLHLIKEKNNNNKRNPNHLSTQLDHVTHIHTLEFITMSLTNLNYTNNDIIR